MDLSLWLGPIASFQFLPKGWPAYPGSSVANFEVHTQAQAAPLLASWLDSDGRYVPGMLRALGLDPSQVSRLFIGSFSAGHNIAKKITLHPDDRAMITALMLADSEQSSWQPGHTLGVVPPGYLAYCQESAAGAPRLFCATASTATDGSYASSQATMDALLAEVTAEPSFSVGAPDVSPAPTGVWALGNAITLSYGSSIAHDAHATIVMPQLWQGLLTPWVDSGGAVGTPPGGDDGGGGDNPTASPAPTSGSGGWGLLLGLLALGGLALGGYQYGRR